jgi:8-hydroxy-5-deazaflavin:NADPH oxidoreductase
MKIGVLGSGEVAKVLASGFLKHGHKVKVGSRSPEKLRDWAKENPKGSTGTFSDAAEFGEMVVLAVNGKVTSQALRLAGEENLAGKPVVDTTNPIGDVPPINGVLSFFTDFKQSLMEKLQREFPEAHFVKAFNSVGYGCMVNPQFAGGKPTMFICGNDAVAKKAVGGIVEQFGWDVEDAGTMEAARGIEPLCILWCIPAFQKNDFVHAFKMLR